MPTPIGTSHVLFGERKGWRMISRRLMPAVLWMTSLASPAMADWSVTTGGALFYTDDTALFSATRRSGLDGDPSQPVLDVSRTGKGSDMVFEPDVKIAKDLTSSLGHTTFSVKGQGFIYAVNPSFTQASLTAEARHAFTSTTALRLRYFTAPDQLLGQSEERRTGTFSLQDERVTSHIGSVRLDQRLSDHWEIQLYGRAGIRRYNDAYAQRDTLLWTVGPHLIWHITHHSKVILGYHYERGLAEGRQQIRFEDDNSYVHHFASIGFETEIMEHLDLELDFHYERNNFTSGIPGDERNGGHENIYLGTGRLVYQLTDHTGLTLSVQRANRQQNFEQTHDHNTNVSVGMIYRF
jgi:hypothetical protein